MGISAQATVSSSLTLACSKPRPMPTFKSANAPKSLAETTKSYRKLQQENHGLRECVTCARQDKEIFDRFHQLISSPRLRPKIRYAPKVHTRNRQISHVCLGISCRIGCRCSCTFMSHEKEEGCECDVHPVKVVKCNV